MTQKLNRSSEHFTVVRAVKSTKKDLPPKNSPKGGVKMR